ncbi:TcmI family type II polyketide cyclase [Labedaea rhizosphaerae]|jgi:cyclase|uniref:Cyclase n=1 Tax=Labedaea rhizosphaerae TaxID=598644 RepID=A0A4R6RW75_LABRH|nr:TcmI family type II polyketide cyclase [Labedaea rhizosphaerae]TDP90575.1 cyclase [Labedaea rhizosphaerae]
MYSTLIVGRMDPSTTDEVAGHFKAFDQTEMPHLMGTRRRELFVYNDLYFHLQQFDDDHDSEEAIRKAMPHPLFIDISAKLNALIDPYDPKTWTKPMDAIAKNFYLWHP